MSTSLTNMPGFSRPECEICGCEISHMDTLLNKQLKTQVCRSLDCQRAMSQQPSMTPLLFKSKLAFNKKMIRKQRENSTVKKKHKKEVLEKIINENNKILKSVLNKTPELTESKVRLLDIPSGCSELISVAKTRIEKYIEHITVIIEEASQYESAIDVVHDQHHAVHSKLMKVEARFDALPKLREISDNLCGMCKGGCCAKGGEHAYLSVFTMRSLMDAHPELTIVMLRERYLSHICVESIGSSCINHTKTGCSLPRELRSAICNSYYCDSLKEHHEAMSKKEDDRVLLIVQRSCTNWNRFDPDVSHKVVNVTLMD